MWILAIAWALLAALTAATVATPSGRARLTQRFAGVVNLALTDQVAAAVRAHVVRRTLGAAIGALLAAIAVLAVEFAGIPTGDRGVLVAVLALYAGVALGLVVAAATTPTRRSDDAVRVARATVPRLGDFVPGFELEGSRVVVGLAVLVTAATLVTGSVTGAPVRVDWIAIAVLALLAQLAWEVLGRRLLNRAVVSGTTQELAWNDALRASLLRGTLTLPLTLGVLGALLPVLELALATAPGGRWGAIIAAGVMALLLTAAVGAILATVLAKPARHYQRRLWPTLGGAR